MKKNQEEKRTTPATVPTVAGSPFAATGALPVPRILISAGVTLDPNEEILRQTRMEDMKAKLGQMFAQGKGPEAIDLVMSALLRLEQENERLAWRVLRSERFRFGRSTEKLSAEELKQLFLAFGGTAAASLQKPLLVPTPDPPECESEPESDPEAAQNADSSSSPPEKEKKTRKSRRRMKVADKVERIITLSPVPDDEKTCGICGADKTVIGHVDHERIEFIPARIVLHINRCEKNACLDCRKDVSVAPRTDAPAVVRKVGASLLAKLIADKGAMGMPLERQRRALLRIGFDIPDRTLQSYWAYATDLLEPIAICTLSQVLAKRIVAADDSVLKTLDKDSPNGAFRGRFWAFVGTDDAWRGQEMVAYGYAKSWKATEIVDWFSAIDGDIQCDGYAGYAKEVDDETGPFIAVPDERRLGCGMHIRSKFHAALLAKDKRAVVPLKYFADLYQIEAECKETCTSNAQRGQIRKEKSLPILDLLDQWVDDLDPKLLPKSPLRMATQYAINQRAFFRRCFSNGMFEIDNGRCERAIRIFAIGRRAFLFTGSERGGERLAVVYTLVNNCTILGIDPYVYLLDVITTLESGLPMTDVSGLTPHAWVAQQAAQNHKH